LNFILDAKQKKLPIRNTSTRPLPSGTIHRIATSDYVLALKGNQGTLCEDVEGFVAEQKANNFKNTKVSRHETLDGDHGRIETRTYTAIHDVAWLQERHDWPGLQGVVMVES
jgi:hypothetical protein